VTGFGDISMVFEPDGNLCSGATIQIIEAPPDLDIIYGAPPVIYAGMAGFFTEPSAGFSFATGENRFQLGVSTGQKKYYPPQFINHTVSTFTPPCRDAQGFYYRLKPGVVANITVLGQANMRGSMSKFGPQYFRFNPMAGGFEPYVGLPIPSQ
jgi:hypothetical protein